MRIYTDTVTTSANAATLSAHRTPFVSLLSDFGSRDPSAGIMRAVVAGICPEANVVDITHDVDKYAIRDGALVLWSAAPYLPVGAHVAVVDPGVGTARKGVALQTARGDYLVGPDNGLLMPAAARLGGITAAHLLEEPRYALPDVSTSFHGRDIFAPAGAHLAAGVPIDELGRSVDPRRLLDLEWPRPEIRRGAMRAQTIYIDTFGNVKLSALADDLASALPSLRFGERLVLRVEEGSARREVPITWVATFGEVPEGAPLLTADSYGRVAVSVHQGSAASAFGLELDTTVEVARPVPPLPPRRAASPPARSAPPRGPAASPPARPPGSPPARPPGSPPRR
ncbi:MAG: SAM-dependent chlorinase/fluorinase [Candidatus Limnocylindrales bacterium]